MATGMAPPPPPRRAVDDLVCRHLCLVTAAVARLSTRVPPHVDRDDLLAAGHLGLVQAARAFEPARGVPFDRYAQRRITGAIQDQLRALDASSRRSRTAMRRLDGATDVLSMQLGRLPSTSEVARWLGQDDGGVRRTRAESAQIMALRRPRLLDESEGVIPPATGLEPETAVLAAEMRQDLADAVAALPPRLALVVVAHILDGREVKSIAADFGVTPSRVSQLCGEALALLRSALDDTDVAPAGAAPARPTSHQRRTTYLDAVRTTRRQRHLERAPGALVRAS
jgi:RNA polymerase sigma factor for flagellar operon FliA